MKKTTELDYQERLQKVLLHIRRNLYEDISLKTLASLACFSEFHFHRIFRGMTGETVAEHVRRLKLHDAARGLRYSPRSVTDIAFEAGYSTLESFIRAFRSRYGVTPSEYRDNGRKVLERAAGIKPKKGAKIMIDATIKKIGARKVAYVKHIGPYAQCGKAWETLCRLAGPAGLLGKNTQFLGLSYDDPDITPADKQRYDACVVLPENAPPVPGLSVQEIPAGDYASTVHKGPYETMNGTYVKLSGEWLPKSGRAIKNAPSVEIYLNDPDATPAAERLTEIQVPLE